MLENRVEKSGWTINAKGVQGKVRLQSHAHLLDASLDPLKPEALLYEPVRGGGFKLVGVEYLVPYAAWTSSTPPVLFGQSFLRNDVLSVWALHFWIWTENPSGYFADWNPLVSCHRAATP